MELKKVKNALFVVTYTLLLAFVLFRFEKIEYGVSFMISVFLPFILGGALAFILNVPMSFIERVLFDRFDNKFINKIKRTLSIILTLTLVTGVIGLVMFVVVPELGNTILKLAESISGFPKKCLKFIDKYDIDVPMIKNYIEELNINWSDIASKAASFAKNGIGNIFNSTFGIISSVISKITCGVIAFVFSIYVLSQKEKLASQFKRLVYAFLSTKKADTICRVFALAKVTFSNFITGQCFEAIILGLMFFITLTILDFHYALLIGVLIAVTALVPIFGAFVGCGVGMFLLLVEDPMQAVWFFVIFQILQQIEGNLIYPYVVGGSVGLPSIWVLVSVTVGGNLFGLVGMICFIPLSSVAYALLREKVHSIEEQHNISLMPITEEQQEQLEEAMEDIKENIEEALQEEKELAKEKVKKKKKKKK